MALILYGYRYSVYTRIARMALILTDAPYQEVEVDPFDDPPDPALRAISPFGRVPVLDHDGFVLCETRAITHYVADRFDGGGLIPATPQARARMEQVMSVIDAYGYWPMVRQVFSHGVFRPLIRAEADLALIEAGLAASAPVLDLLNTLAQEGLVLNRREVSLADLHLAPMMGYFTSHPQGQVMVQDRAALQAWWAVLAQHSAYLDTDPGLATLAGGA